MSNSQKRRGGANAVAAARAGQRSSAALRIWIVSAVVAIAVLVGVVIAVNRGVNNDTSSAGGSSDSGVTMPASVLSDDGIKLAVGAAGVDVQLWIDMQCPACKAYEARVDSALEKYVANGTASLTVHPIAILDNSSSTKYSTRAGSAVVCAAAEGKFWQYSKALFENQPAEGSAGLTDDELVKYGVEAGLTSAAFKTCVTSQAQSAWIAASTKAATAAGVTGTPTIKVEGKSLTSGTLEELESAIKAAAS